MTANAATLGDCLSHWLTVRCLNRKPKTQQFYREMVTAIVREQPPELALPAATLSALDVVAFAARFTAFCPSRWNSFVSFLRETSPHGRTLPRRRLNVRQFTAPTQAQFAALLVECDRAPRSQAGLVVRFLALTGLRIAEARGLRWEHVHADHLEVPADLAKGGHRRSVPLLPGLQDVLMRLQGLDSGGFVLPRSNPRKVIERITRRLFGRSWSFHCFRHLFTTRCVETPVDLPTVARWLGHQDGGALLARTYFHLVDEHSRIMAARVKV